MSLQNIKKMKADKGFTIVELLIVIVIIGILAAITIVAYNGIQNRGKAAAGQSLANSIVKKAEAYAAVKGVYPTHAQLIAVTTDPTEAKLDDANAVVIATAAAGTPIDATLADSGKKVYYYFCSTTAGVNVVWWDYSKTSGQATPTKAGTGC
jgi:prepilin-type N-terminal cleavage/methylation domain-containing protein